MTREEAKALIDAMVAMRETATDEQAANAAALYPVWAEGKRYTANQRLRHEGVLYKVLQTHISQAGWKPTSAPSLFAKVLIPNTNVIPEWEQPDSTNPYMKGDKVRYNGVVYESLVDNNVWNPADYTAGWQAVKE